MGLFVLGRCRDMNSSWLGSQRTGLNIVIQLELAVSWLRQLLVLVLTNWVVQTAEHLFPHRFEYFEFVLVRAV